MASELACGAQELPDTPDIYIFGIANCDYTYHGRNDCIGQGGYGTVYKATVTKSGDYKGKMIVAVKQIRLNKDEIHQLKDKAKKENFERRWRTLLCLAHENLVSYHKITMWETRNIVTVEFMMDYCNDGDLSGFIKNAEKRLSPINLTDFAQQLSKGLDFLHARNIIHGDLKPENILVRPLGGMRTGLLIGDLDDLLQMQRSVTCSKDITKLRGTMRYMSPEMLQKFVAMSEDTELHIGRKTDIWSLGCIVLELADWSFGITEKWLSKDYSEHLRLEKSTPDHVFIAKVTDGYRPSIAPALPDNIALIVERCLSTNPIFRPSAQLLVDDWLVKSGGTDDYRFRRAVEPSEETSDKSQNQLNVHWKILEQEAYGLLIKKQFAEAVTTYTLAINQNSEEFALYAHRACCYRCLGLNNDARNDAEKALQLDPKSIEMHLTLSEILLVLNLFNEALTICQRALKLDSNNSKLLMQEGDLTGLLALQRADRNSESVGGYEIRMSHLGVTCNYCKARIIGTRYICVICEDVIAAYS